jgi:Fe-S-cluster-containing hydrogenase component 2
MIAQSEIGGNTAVHKALLIDPHKCTSCLQCEMACSFEHEGVFNPAKSRIKIFEFEHGRFSIPYTCTQCAESWCARSCPVEALTRHTQTNAIEVNETLCVGCKVCTIACPFGTINYNQASKTVFKCDLCGGDPACAKACPTDAITYVEDGWTGLSRMEQSARSGHGRPQDHQEATS